VQVTVMQVVGVVIVNDRRMAAIHAVLVSVVFVDLVLIRHYRFPLKSAARRGLCVAGVVEGRSERMSQTIEDQVQNVLIGQIVKNVLSVTPPSDDVVETKNAEAL
jgi:hypothetical protein